MVRTGECDSEEMSGHSIMLSKPKGGGSGRLKEWNWSIWLAELGFSRALAGKTFDRGRVDQRWGSTLSAARWPSTAES